MTYDGRVYMEGEAVQEGGDEIFTRLERPDGGETERAYGQF